MNVIKQLFEGVKDKEQVHQRFVRLGKGNYERFYVNVKKGKNLIVKTSFDFANDLLGLVAENIDSEAEISGKIICNYDFENEMPCEVANFTKRGKLYTAELKTTVKPEVLKEIYKKFKLQFLLINVKSERYNLKCAKSLPKPGGKIKDNFCSATLPLELVDEFAFGIGEFKEAKIKHIVNITEIEIPEEFKNDSAKARIEALRKGVIKRIIEIDGKVTEKETEFSA
ncbi:MAG: hypothetical protein V1914_01020 [archaeon]